MLPLPAVNFLQHGFADEVTDPVEVVVAVDDPNEILVVTPFDPSCDRHFRQDSLLGFGQGGGRHQCNGKMRRVL